MSLRVSNQWHLWAVRCYTLNCRAVGPLPAQSVGAVSSALGALFPNLLPHMAMATPAPTPPPLQKSTTPGSGPGTARGDRTRGTITSLNLGNGLAINSPSLANGEGSLRSWAGRALGEYSLSSNTTCPPPCLKNVGLQPLGRLHQRGLCQQVNLLRVVGLLPFKIEAQHDGVGGLAGIGGRG